jgi:hypothetical protein
MDGTQYCVAAWGIGVSYGTFESQLKFYINKVSKTDYGVGVNSLILNQTSRILNLEIARKYHLLENGLVRNQRWLDVSVYCSSKLCPITQLKV